MRRIAAASARRAIGSTVLKNSLSAIKPAALTFYPRLYNSVRCSSTLSKLIAQEISKEKSQESHELVDSTLKQIQSQVLTIFKLDETPGNTIVKLTRTYKDEQIEVTFNVEDTTDVMDERLVDLEKAEDVSPGGVMIPIEIKITKGDDILYISATASDYLTIFRVGHEDPEVVDAPDRWQGPDFHFLGDDLQLAFYELLQERKIDQDLCFFILAYTYKKENNEYLHWLNSLKRFTADN